MWHKIWVKINFYNDPDTGEPHIFKHNVTEKEIFDFFSTSSYFEFKRRDISFEAFGNLKNGRFLQVAYRKENDGSIFVITAYDIEDKEMIHFIKDSIWK